MTVVDEIDLSKVPAVALRPALKEKICSMMNYNLIIPSPGGYLRDYRGLAELLKVKPPCGYMQNPTGHILSQFEKLEGSTLLQLLECFKELDRWDVFDDTEENFYADAKNYLQVIQNSPGEASNAQLDFLSDDIVTLDDLHRAGKNLPLLKYDAFVLFADEDEDFAVEIINKLENDYSAKVCHKGRFIAGLPLEHIGVMQMLKERCRRLIVIISNNFIRSRFNQYFLNFASAVSIEQRRVQIVPIVMEYCEDLPAPVKYCHLLDFNRRSKLWNFWEKLRLAVVIKPIPCDFSERPMIKDVEEDHTMTDSLGKDYPLKKDFGSKEDSYWKQDSCNSENSNSKEETKMMQDTDCQLLKELMGNIDQGQLDNLDGKSKDMASKSKLETKLMKKLKKMKIFKDKNKKAEYCHS